MEGAAKRETSTVPSLPPPLPKSPPPYPDLYGKRRELARVQMLEREIGFLEEELKTVGRLQPASHSCKEVADFVMANSDPLVTKSRKIRRSRRFWKWLCGKSCFNLSWMCCCCGCCPRLRKPDCCSCSCDICNCNPCACCSMPKCPSCPSFPTCPSCRTCSTSCWPCCCWPCCCWPCTCFQCSKKGSCGNCCECEGPSCPCPDCSCSCTCSCSKCSTCCCRPRCPKVPRCSCIKNCCYSCCLCF